MIFTVNTAPYPLTPNVPLTFSLLPKYFILFYFIVTKAFLFFKHLSITLEAPRAKCSYQEKINNFAEWCTENNLLLNVNKSKELIVHFRKKEAKTHPPVYISGAEIEQLNSCMFLGINIMDNRSWSSYITTLVKRAQNSSTSYRN